MTLLFTERNSWPDVAGCRGRRRNSWFPFSLSFLFPLFLSIYVFRAARDGGGMGGKGKERGANI